MAAEGLQAASDYIDLLETQLERCRDENRRRELDGDIDMLQTVEKHLETIGKNCGMFYFLAEDDKWRVQSRD